MSNRINTQHVASRYGEISWQGNDEAVVDKGELAEAILDGVNKFDALEANISSWRERVFVGSLDYSDAIDGAMRRELGNWIEHTERIVIPAIDAVEKSGKGNDVPYCRWLRQRLLTGLRLRREWKAPALSAVVGFREDSLDAEATAEVFGALCNKTARPTLPPRRIVAVG